MHSEMYPRQDSNIPSKPPEKQHFPPTRGTESGTVSADLATDPVITAWLGLSAQDRAKRQSDVLKVIMGI
jgi:hypothetical protein